MTDQPVEITTVLRRLAGRQALTVAETRAVFDEMLAGRLSALHIASILTALTVRGPVDDELLGAAQALMAAVTMPPITAEATDSHADSLAHRLPWPRLLIDTCGTGGDGTGTFNISTAAAIVTAAVGAGRLAVAKHGNRAVTSRSGSADVLAHLGVNIDPGPAVVTRCLRECGIGFLFAPTYHAAMRHAAPVRRELGFPTLLNLVGPLCNPAGVHAQVVGVNEMSLTTRVAGILGRMGRRCAMVVHSADGLDEVSDAAPTHVAYWRHGVVTQEVFDPREMGLAPETPSDASAALRVEGPGESAAMIRRVFKGLGGRPRHVVLLNAAAALQVADIAPDWATGVAMASAAIDDGRCTELLTRWARLSHEPA